MENKIKHQIKPGRGGARPGAGRKKLDHAEKKVRIVLFVKARYVEEVQEAVKEITKEENVNNV